MSSDPHDDTHDPHDPHDVPHDALYALLRAADPAPSGRALGVDPASLEAAMSEITTTQTPAGDRGRSW
ncbi:MAG: hypothetical protein WAL50_15560, partial [Kineosporiaceae bacterium]